MNSRTGSKILLKDLGSSIRRHLVDEFHFHHVPTISEGSLVLDVGGNRMGKRGLFDVEKYNFEVVYANLSRAKKPDVQSDASCLPFREAAFDAVICSELLEHVPYPPDVLREIFRVLRKNGMLLICVPFLIKIHGDPYDYARYTDYYWSETLRAAGFSGLVIEKQGSFWCVLIDMLREMILRKTSGGGLLSKSWPKMFLERTISLAKAKAIAWDSRSYDRNETLYSGFTTGFGIKAIK